MTRSFTALLASTVAVAALFSATAASAETRRFTVPSGEAAKSIAEFARQAGLQITAPVSDLKGVRTPAVTGDLEVRAALSRLIEGAGLEVVSDDGATIVLGRAAQTRQGGAELATSRQGAADLEEVVVTSSRIVRDGFEAPTPTTVLGLAEIQQAAPANIADLVNQLPALVGSATPGTNPGQISNGGTGINALNLRNLGTARTLILLDGKRVPAATVSTSLVDINTLPNALIKRIDIVTGGASAAWGSDAVAGVVNFVLDTEFTGVKGDIQGGVSTYGDNESATISLSAGTPFQGGRGHALVSVESAHNAGIDGLPRSWYKGAKLFNNPAYLAGNGQPEFIVQEGTGFSTVAPGAVVVSGPLRGLYFGPGGAPAQLNYGSIVSDPYMTGGDWKYTDFGKGPQDLRPKISRQNLFTRLSYDLTDDLQVYGQFSYARAKTSMNSTPQFNFGGITIQRDNAFLPGDIATRMTALGLTSLNVGSWNADLGGILAKTTREQFRYMAGATGGVSLFGTDWTWDLYGNRNISKIQNSAVATVTSRYRAAIDAVRSANGSIVCRSTLTAPNNGCVPYNILGTGTASDAAKAYVLGTSRIDAQVTQDDFAASLHGDPLSTWAGPVSIALGVEHRREAIVGQADPTSLVNGYWAGNFKPFDGSYTVNEGFLEAVVPLAKDQSWAKTLDLNGAVRATDYSTSGFVATWKVGLSFTPIEDIRIRATRSRDIRAGNLPELFAAGQAQNFTIADPFRGNETTNYFQIQGGNPNLKPEKADTIDIGVILQPRAIPALRASVDYFDIDVKDAVVTIGGGTILNKCYEGDAVLCSEIVRDASGKIAEINVRPINFARQRVRGLDFEASYRLQLAQGSLTLRGLASRYLQAETDNGIDPPTSSLGAGTAKWRYRVQGIYQNGPLTVSATGRGSSPLLYSTTYFECASNCPASTPQNRTINNNHIDAAFYVDVAASFKFGDRKEFYLAVDNIANTAPAVAASGPGIGSAPLGVNSFYYDTVGRTFRGGVRFQF